MDLLILIKNGCDNSHRNGCAFGGFARVCTW